MSLRSGQQRECVPRLTAVEAMAPQALHEVAAVLERPLTHLGIIKQTSPYSSFYSLSGTDIDGANVDFAAYRNKVRAVCVGLGFAPRSCAAAAAR